MRLVGIEPKVVDVVNHHIQVNQMNSHWESGAKHEWIGNAMLILCAISSDALYASR